MKEPTETTLTEIAEQLAKAIRLLALLAVSDKKQREQISILSRAGLGRHEIAEILNTTPGTVSVELTALKKLSPRKGKRR